MNQENKNESSFKKGAEEAAKEADKKHAEVLEEAASMQVEKVDLGQEMNKGAEMSM